MNLSRIFLVASAIAVLPLTSFAQSADDVAYCKALSEQYRAFAKSNSVDATAAAAMAQCDRNPKAGIPALEKHLRDSKVDLPPR